MPLTIHPPSVLGAAIKSVASAAFPGGLQAAIKLASQKMTRTSLKILKINNQTTSPDTQNTKPDTQKTNSDTQKTGPDTQKTNPGTN